MLRDGGSLDAAFELIKGFGLTFEQILQDGPALVRLQLPERLALGASLRTLAIPHAIDLGIACS